jgi:hypothetical protein
VKYLPVVHIHNSEVLRGTTAREIFIVDGFLQKWAKFLKRIFSQRKTSVFPAHN